MFTGEPHTWNKTHSKSHVIWRSISPANCHAQLFNLCHRRETSLPVHLVGEKILWGHVWIIRDLIKVSHVFFFTSLLQQSGQLVTHNQIFSYIHYVYCAPKNWVHCIFDRISPPYNCVWSSIFKVYFHKLRRENVKIKIVSRFPRIKESLIVAKSRLLLVGWRPVSIDFVTWLYWDGWWKPHIHWETKAKRPFLIKIEKINVPSLARAAIGGDVGHCCSSSAHACMLHCTSAVMNELSHHPHRCWMEKIILWAVHEWGNALCVYTHEVTSLQVAVHLSESALGNYLQPLVQIDIIASLQYSFAVKLPVRMYRQTSLHSVFIWWVNSSNFHNLLFRYIYLGV